MNEHRLIHKRRLCVKTDKDEDVTQYILLIFNYRPQRDLPCMHSSISGPPNPLPGHASQDGLRDQPEQSAASKPPGAPSVESSWDPQRLPPLDTQRSLGGGKINNLQLCFRSRHVDYLSSLCACTCIGKLSSELSDLHHSFIPQPTVLTKPGSTASKFTSTNSTWTHRYASY